MVRAILTSGGRGERLGLLTKCHPAGPDDKSFNQNAVNKGMAMICGRPMLWHVIDPLVSAGVQDVRIGNGYLGEQIVRYFGDGRSLFDGQVAIQHHGDANPFGGSGSSLLMAEDNSDETLVCYADVLIDHGFDYAKMLRFHQAAKADVTILVKHFADIRKFGIINYDPNSCVISELTEIPFAHYPEPVAGWGNCAVYVLSPRAVERALSDLKPWNGQDKIQNDFMHGVFPRLRQSGLSFYAYPYDSGFYGVNYLTQYFYVQWQVLTGKIDLKIPGKLYESVNSRIWVEGNPVINPSAELRGYIYISSGARLGRQARIRNAVIGGEGEINGEAQNSIFPAPFGVKAAEPFTLASGTKISQSILCGGRLEFDLDSQIAAWNGREMMAEHYDFQVPTEVETLAPLEKP